jgi:hypothetical protein
MLGPLDSKRKPSTHAGATALKGPINLYSWYEKNMIFSSTGGDILC